MSTSDTPNLSIHELSYLYLPVKWIPIFAQSKFYLATCPPSPRLTGPVGTVKLFLQWIARKLFALVRLLPGAQAKIDRELGKVLNELETKLLHVESAMPKLRQLPTDGLSDQEVLEQLSKYV